MASLKHDLMSEYPALNAQLRANHAYEFAYTARLTDDIADPGRERDSLTITGPIDRIRWCPNISFLVADDCVSPEESTHIGLIRPLEIENLPTFIVARR